MLARVPVFMAWYMILLSVANEQFSDFPSLLLLSGVVNATPLKKKIKQNTLKKDKTTLKHILQVGTGHTVDF